ncbi:hypothetical protein ABZ438_19720 [Streptomyces sp. NPDC005786]|uniref:hypothetical protein n=1 Tax=Streptomyces sp. NPDC005786 TaxID=3154891 RepID=UPI0033C6718F
MTGLPVVDLACNGRAHPSSVMGAMGLHQEENYLSSQGYAGGEPYAYVEGSVSGGLEATSNVVRRASVEAGGWVGVARNPVEVGYAVRHGAPGAIGQIFGIGVALPAPELHDGNAARFGRAVRDAALRVGKRIGDPYWLRYVESDTGR